MHVTFVNSKGGVGKSTLAVHLAVLLFDRGAKVGFLDCDKQRSSSQWIREAEPGVVAETASSTKELVVNARRLLQSTDYLVTDGPGGLDEMSRTLLILADLALCPISPSILDMRSMAIAAEFLEEARTIRDDGLPEGKLILNKMRTRDTISRELTAAAPSLGLTVADSKVRDLQAFRDAAQQGTVVTRMPPRAMEAAKDITTLFDELIVDFYATPKRVANT